MQRQGAPNNKCIITVFICDVCWSKTSFPEKKIKIVFVTAAFKSILTSYNVLFAYAEYYMNQIYSQLSLKMDTFGTGTKWSWPS